MAIRLSVAAGCFLCLALTACVGSRVWLLRQAHGLIYKNVQAVPSAPVAIVFGARVHENGVISITLRNRIDTGVKLYKTGKVRTLILTGDDGSRHTDEVGAMAKRCISEGIPTSAIVRDEAGFRTYDSCYRAHRVFGVDRAILVTQATHLPRALYLSQSAGLHAVGCAAPDCPSVGYMLLFNMREVPASGLAIVDTHSPWHRAVDLHTGAFISKATRG